MKAENIVQQRRIETLAGEFNLRLRQQIGVKRFNLVCERNAKETTSGICHSHDFCDANETMFAAYKAIIGPMDLNSDSDTAIWNAAWSHAKALQVMAVQAMGSFAKSAKA